MLAWTEHAQRWGESIWAARLGVEARQNPSFGPLDILSFWSFGTAEKLQSGMPFGISCRKQHSRRAIYHVCLGRMDVFVLGVSYRLCRSIGKPHISHMPFEVLLKALLTLQHEFLVHVRSS